MDTDVVLVSPGEEFSANNGTVVIEDAMGGDTVKLEPRERLVIEDG